MANLILWLNLAHAQIFIIFTFSLIHAHAGEFEGLALTVNYSVGAKTKGQVFKIVQGLNVNVTENCHKNLIGELQHKMEYYDVKEGTNVNLTCTYRDGSSSNNQLNWTMPENASNKSANHFIYRKFKPKYTVHRVHEIAAATVNDSGVYTCIVNSGDLRHPIFINVIPNNYYNVTLQPVISELIRYPKRENFTWQVLFPAHADPIFILRKGDDIIVDTSRPFWKNRFMLEVDKEWGVISLKISSPTINDIGNYTLEARIEKDQEIMATSTIQLSYSIPVPPSRPTIKILPNPTNKMVYKNESFEVECKSQGYPLPSILLEFSRCFNKENCTDFKPVQEILLENNNHLRELPDRKGSESAINGTWRWSGLALVQGRYRCTAKNPHGPAQNETLDFLVADGNQGSLGPEVEVNGKEIGQSIPEIMEGDNLTIRCRGNKMLTPASFNLMMTDQTGNNTKVLWKKVEKADTDLSYVSTLLLENVSHETALTVGCMDPESALLSSSLTIRAHEIRAPTWKLEGQPLQSLELKEMDNLTLNCPADGEPAPVLRWYKDGKLLPENINETRRRHYTFEGFKLSFLFMQVYDSGKYKCEAINRAGTISSEATITVTESFRLFNAFVFFSILGAFFLVFVCLSIFSCREIYKNRKRAHSRILENYPIFMNGDPENLSPELGLEEQAELLPYDTTYEVSPDSIVLHKILGKGHFGLVYKAEALGLIPGQARTTVAVKIIRSSLETAQLRALCSEVKIMIYIGRHVNIVNLMGVCSKQLFSKGELRLLVEYCRYGNILDYLQSHHEDFVKELTKNDNTNSFLEELKRKQRNFSHSRSNQALSLKYAQLLLTRDSVEFTSEQGPSVVVGSMNTAEKPCSPPGSVHNGRDPQDFSPADSFHERFSDLGVKSHSSHLTRVSVHETPSGYVRFSESNVNREEFSSRVLLSWAFQIARGMEYLAFKKILHRDLAARNILLTEGNVVKISDFGLARNTYKNDKYMKKSKTGLPWKWLAPECIRNGVFSTQSDVWSYGVVLWEVFSLGQIPYPDADFDEIFLSKLEKGCTLNKPKYATHNLYRVMQKCWDSDPVKRPSFAELGKEIGDFLYESDKQNYLDLNIPYQELNENSTTLSLLQNSGTSTQAKPQFSQEDSVTRQSYLEMSSPPQARLNNKLQKQS